ncbi:MAG: peptidylprolyl isomerase [Deltaproteobacteria bacterium]|nr:peptidylprolyl isomerase [Deltaproteobacteria bacterium]
MFLDPGGALGYVCRMGNLRCGVRFVSWFGLALLGWPGVGWPAGPAADEVAARVNGTVISRTAVRAVVQGLAAARDAAPDAKQIEQLSRDALDSLIAFELLYQESQRRSIGVSEADIDAEVEHTKGRFASGEDYAAALAQRRLSVEDVRRDTRKTLAVNRLLEQTAWQGIEVSSAQVRRFYEENREQFKRPAEIRASHILVRGGQEAAAAERASAQQRVQALLAEIQGGADFAALARQHSQDPATAATGGDLGFFSRGTMEPAFEQAAFALKPGTVSSVVQTPYGFHLIKVTDQRPAGYAPLAEVQADVSALLRDEEKRRRQDQLVAKLKQQAQVELLPLLKPSPKPKAAPATKR